MPTRRRWRGPRPRHRAGDPPPVGLAMPVGRSRPANAAVIAHPDGSLGPIYERGTPSASRSSPRCTWRDDDRPRSRPGGRGGTLHLLRPQIPGTAPAGRRRWGPRPLDQRELAPGPDRPLAVLAIARRSRTRVASSPSTAWAPIPTTVRGQLDDHRTRRRHPRRGGRHRHPPEADLDLDELLGQGPSPLLVDRRDELLGRAEIDRALPAFPTNQSGCRQGAPRP